MPAIFFDLETSDRETVGQILNYSFIVTDDQLQIQDELNGDIRLSRLQLPSPGAILTNRVNVLQHQETVADDEFTAMGKIVTFLNNWISRSRDKIFLIGFNSSRFDVGYLRTSLIRNGFNPYFGGRLIYRDLLHAVRKLFVTNPRFPRVAKSSEGEEASRLSLSLQTVTRELGLLEGEQSHHSRADVVLSIDLSRVLRDRFDFDLLGYESFELMTHARSSKVGDIIYSIEPEYDLSLSERVKQVPLLLLDQEGRNVLWVAIERFAAGEGRQSIKWMTSARHHLMVEQKGRDSASSYNGKTLEEWATLALKEFAGITTKNFFARSTCDCELDVYREMDIQSITALGQAIAANNGQSLAHLPLRDPKVLFLRQQLARYQWQKECVLNASNEMDARMAKRLRDYALYRYGGRMQLIKALPEDVTLETHAGQGPFFHPSLTGMLGEVDRELGSEKRTPADRKLLESLRSYYLNSEIVKLAGDELLAVISG